MNHTFSNETAGQELDSMTSKVFKTTAYALILLISLLGNTLLILAIKRNINGRMRTVSNLLIASVAVSDLVMTVWSIPERMTRTISHDAWLIPGAGGSVLCKIVNFAEKLSITVSVLHLGALALERFLVVFSPYKTVIKPRIVKYIISGIWVSSALYWSPILYYGKIMDTDKLKCEVRRFVKDWRSWYVAFIVVLCAVMVAILVLYTALAMHLCRRKDPSMRLASQRNKSDHIKRRVAAMVGVIIVAFYLSFLPYWIGWVWCSYASSRPKNICNQTYKFISILLSYASCMVNPIICFTFVGHFRFAFKAILIDPLNRKSHETRLRLRQKSSLTELDTVPQSRKSFETPKETSLLVCNQDSKEYHGSATGHNEASLVISQTITEQSNSSERNSNGQTKRGNVNTNSKKEANLSKNIEGGKNIDKLSHKCDKITRNNSCRREDVITMYGTPL